MKDEFEREIRCESEGKICYTEREAGNAINGAKHHGNKAKKIPQRKYFCKECRCFHLTSRKSDKCSCSKQNYRQKLKKILLLENERAWREEYFSLSAA